MREELKLEREAEPTTRISQKLRCSLLRSFHGRWKVQTLGWERMKGVIRCCSEVVRKRRNMGALKLVGRQG